jgi:hypothetical protein
VVRFQTRLDGRDPNDIVLKADEAWAMFGLGFEFSIYGGTGNTAFRSPMRSCGARTAMRSSSSNEHGFSDNPPGGIPRARVQDRVPAMPAQRPR